MRVRQMAVDLGAALAAGYVATRVSDRAQSLLYRMTPVSEKLREPDYPDCSTAEQAARMAADSVGIARTRRRIGVLKSCIHYGLGMGWSAIYPPLRRRGIGPLAAGVATGASLSLLVDEALCPALGITAPNSAYPPTSHARGVATHLVYGLAVAVAAETLHRLIARAGAVQPLPEDSPTVSAT